MHPQSSAHPLRGPSPRLPSHLPACAMFHRLHAAPCAGLVLPAHWLPIHYSTATMRVISAFSCCRLAAPSTSSATCPTPLSAVHLSNGQALLRRLPHLLPCCCSSPCDRSVHAAL